MAWTRANKLLSQSSTTARSRHNASLKGPTRIAGRRAEECFLMIGLPLEVLFDEEEQEQARDAYLYLSSSSESEKSEVDHEHQPRSAAERVDDVTVSRSTNKCSGDDTAAADFGHERAPQNQHTYMQKSHRRTISTTRRYCHRLTFSQTIF